MALNRLSQRLTETFKESTRDLPILQGKGPAAQTYFEYNDDRLREIAQLFDGSSNKSTEAARLEGMKRLIAMISKGRDMSAFFPQVVKQVASPSVEIRKLVYIYLLRYAETNSDLLLLSINTFQRDLADPSPLIRSMAIRVLTSIRLSVIQGIVMLGLEKLVHDRNPWVRKTVALGLIKVYDSDSTTLPQLKAMLVVLLKSSNPITIGATIQAVDAICPDQLEILHPYYRKICMLLIDSDEWGQIAVLAVLQRYVRNYLEKPDVEAVQNHDGASQRANGSEPTSVPDPGQSSTPVSGNDMDATHSSELDPDLELLLHCTLPLFQSRNPAVTLAAVRLFYLCAPPQAQSEDMGQRNIVPALLRLCSATSETSGIAWTAWEVVREIAEQRPWLFSDRVERLFVRSSDSTRIKKHKIAILSCLLDENNASLLIREFKEYARTPQSDVSTDAIQAIGRCAERVEAVKSKCGKVLLSLLKSGRNATVAQAVIALRSLVQSLPGRDSASSLVLSLTRRLSFIHGEDARASVFWLGSRYGIGGDDTGSRHPDFEGIAIWAPDLLREGVRSFMSEGALAKIEILNLSAALLTHCPSSKVIHMLNKHVLNLGRYDQDWDVRDRARLLAGLLRSVRRPNDGEDGEEENDTGGVVLRPEQIKLVLSDRANLKQGSDRGRSRRSQPMASLSGFNGRPMRGSTWDVPEWTTEPTDSSFRDTPERPMSPEPETAVTNQRSEKASTTPSFTSRVAFAPSNPNFSSGQRVKKVKNLDEFLEETESEDISGEDDESEREDVSRQNQRLATSEVRRPGNLPSHADDASSDSSLSDSESESE